MAFRFGAVLDDRRPMIVGILGSGAVGCVVGAALASAGHDVWLLHRRAEVAETLRRDGVRMERDGQLLVEPVRASVRRGWAGSICSSCW